MRAAEASLVTDSLEPEVQRRDAVHVCGGFAVARLDELTRYCRLLSDQTIRRIFLPIE
jgi:hypothetical protein